MNSFYAICPFCGKSIFVEENASGGYSCSVCGQALGMDYLRKHDLIINADAAEKEYETAQQYFMNSNFIDAATHYRKVTEYNRNHYLSEYYQRLCEVYLNEDKADYNVPQKISEALKISVEKMGLCQVNVQARTEFLVAVLNQAYIILSSHFNHIYEKYEKNEMWDILRDKCLNLATAVKSLTDIDKEAMLLFDGTISKSLISIADLGICACQKVVQPHLVSDTILDLPTDFAYEKAKSIHGNLLYYAISLDSEYTFSSYKPDYTANLIYNENVSAKLNRYNSENKFLQKKNLSTPGKSLNAFRNDAAIAIKYSYHTCFKSLYVPQNDYARTAIVNAAIVFGFELLSPRVYADDKRIYIDSKNYSKSKEIGQFLAEFLNDLYTANPKSATDYAIKYFKQLYDVIKQYFTLIFNVFGKVSDKLKAMKNEEYDYYKNFLHKAVYGCATALTEVVPILDKRITGERLKVLKLGKQILEEFLLLSDYKIEELDQSAQYSDVLDIFNAFDNDLQNLTKR